VRIAPGTNASVDLLLEVARLNTRVLVTASGTPQSVDEIAKAMDVLDASDFNRRQLIDLPQALKLTPGLRVEQLGGPGSLTRIQTRGMRVYDTSLLIDGFRFRDTTAPQGDASAFLGDFQILNSDRIEVLRGSGSSLYGTNAIAGVVNMVTDQGGGPFHGDVSGEGGGLGLLRGVARAAGGAWHDRLRYSGGLGHLNVMEGVDGDDRYRNSSAQGGVQIRVTPGAQFTARIFATDSFAGLNSSPSAGPAANLPPRGIVRAIAPAEDQIALGDRGLKYDAGNATFIPSFNDPDFRRSSRFFSGLATFSQRLSSTVSYRVAYQGLTTRRDNRNGPAGPGFQSAYETDNLFDGRLDTLQVRTDLQLGPFNLVSAGYEFGREEFDNHGSDLNPNLAFRTDQRTNVTQRSHSIFAQDQIRLFRDRIQVMLSGRVETFDLGQPVFIGGAPKYGGVAIPTPPNAYTGDAAVSYFLPRSGTKLRAHVGNGYRVASLYERFGSFFFGGSFTALGDPRLAPERSIGADAGVDQYFAHSKARLSATYFYTRLQQVIGYDLTGLVNRNTDPFGRSSGYFNTHGGLARGVELSLQATPVRSLTLFTSYTYTNSDEKTPVVPETIRSLRIFEHTFTMSATEHVGRWEGTFDFLAASNYLAPFFTSSGTRAFEFHGPRNADLVVAYTLPISDRRSVRFFTRIDNLFNQTYYEDGFRTPKRWAIGGLKFQF
jgi:iron complex outermembrane receptor protein